MGKQMVLRLLSNASGVQDQPDVSDSHDLLEARAESGSKLNRTPVDIYQGNRALFTQRANKHSCSTEFRRYTSSKYVRVSFPCYINIIQLEREKCVAKLTTQDKTPMFMYDEKRNGHLS